LKITRIHYVVFYGALAAVMSYLGAYAIPINTDTYKSASYIEHYISGDAYAFVAIVMIISTMLATFYWVFLQLRDRRHHPFRSGGHLWFLFPVYILCLFVINSAPFVMSIKYMERIQKLASVEKVVHYISPLHKEPVLIGFALMIITVIAGLVNVARVVPVRQLMITAIVIVGSFFLFLLMGEVFKELSVVIWSIWSCCYVISFATVLIFHRRRRVTPFCTFALIFIFLSSPAIALIGFAFSLYSAQMGRMSDSWIWISLAIGAGFSVIIALILEKTLTWLRALPR
jgi:hypothetical protein